MKLYLLLSCLFALFLFGCNPIQDAQDAQKFADDYYAVFKAQDYDKALAMYDDRFFEKTPKTEWSDILKNIQTKLGALQKTENTGFHINANVGTEFPGTTVVLQFHNQYAKYESDEVLTLYKATGSDSYKILGYNINSMGFLK